MREFGVVLTKSCWQIAAFGGDGFVGAGGVEVGRGVVDWSAIGVG